MSSIRKLISKIPSMCRSQWLKRAQPDSWIDNSGRIILLGEAAHPFTVRSTYFYTGVTLSGILAHSARDNICHSRWDRRLGCPWHSLRPPLLGSTNINPIECVPRNPPSQMQESSADRYLERVVDATSPRTRTGRQKSGVGSTAGGMGTGSRFGGEAGV